MFYELVIAGQTLHLLPQKAIYWKEHQILIIADVHLGKAGHFRRNGVPVPVEVNNKNLQRIDALIGSLSPKKVIFLGDLYHSLPNDETIGFLKWLNKYPSIEFSLTLGNHDTYQNNKYISQLHISHEEIIEPFIFRHMPYFDIASADKFEICGHIHPSVRVPIKARQSVILPAFIHMQKTLLLPAFGEFTGTFKIEKNILSRYAIVENGVIRV